MTWIRGEVIARGATAVVTRGEPGTAVKIFDPTMPRIVAELEAAGTREAMRAGLPVAELISADLDGEPPSLTFRYVDGSALADHIDDFGAECVGRILADLQARIRAVTNPTAIAAETFFAFRIGQAPMPAALRDAALADLARLTANATRVLCHMDLHDANVLWADGPVIIDWTNAMAAPPEADVARTRMLISHEGMYYSPHQAVELEAIAAAHIARTEQLAPGLVESSRAWDRVVAAARLGEEPPDAERAAILARHARG